MAEDMFEHLYIKQSKDAVVFHAVEVWVCGFIC